MGKDAGHVMADRDQAYSCKSCRHSSLDYFPHLVTTRSQRNASAHSGITHSYIEGLVKVIGRCVDEKIFSGLVVNL